MSPQMPSEVPPEQELTTLQQRKGRIKGQARGLQEFNLCHGLVELRYERLYALLQIWGKSEQGAD